MHMIFREHAISHPCVARYVCVGRAVHDSAMVLVRVVHDSALVLVVRVVGVVMVLGAGFDGDDVECGCPSCGKHDAGELSVTLAWGLVRICVQVWYLDYQVPARIAMIMYEYNIVLSSRVT